LLFVKDFDVPFSNNTAERSFRISKTKLKVSGLFQNQKSSENYAKILSYTETCYRNGVNKYQAILRLLDGNPYTVSELTNSVL
ncbi:MAG: transposase, partial [Bacilli bacterium]